MQIRQLTEAEVEFSILCEPEELPYVGFCSRINAAIDRRAEQWIRQQLERGNEWAWCSVVVTAIWKGFTGSSLLGGCSYRSEAEFCRPGGYYPDLKNDALSDLNREIERVRLFLERLEVNHPLG